MNSISYTICDRNAFEQQLLIYFKATKNIVYLNSNNSEKSNFFAVSNNDYLEPSENQFGFVS